MNNCNYYKKRSKFMEEIRVSSLNVNNLKANLIYTEFLANGSDILYLNEIWCKQNEINLLKSLPNDEKSKNILFKSDIDLNYKKGRPFGGQAWIINKTFTIIYHEFVNRHLSYIQIKKNGLELIIIGVYMPFDNPKKREETLSIYEMSLSLITTICSKGKNLDIPVFIIGDFNADLNRNNRLDIKLQEFTSDLNLISLTSLYNQPVKFTYSSKIRNEMISSNIDYMFFIPDKHNSILIKKCEINDDIANMSDHNSISLLFTYKFKQIDENIPIPKPFKSINFKNTDVIKFYNDSLKFHFNKNNNLKKFNSTQNNQEFIENYYNLIKEIISLAEIDTINYQESLLSRNLTIYKNKKSNNKWFTPNLKIIKQKIIELKNSPNKIQNYHEIRNLRKMFRKIQRENIYSLEKKDIEKFEIMARNKDKSKFWNFINRKKKDRSNDKEVTSSANELFAHYKKFFNEEFSNISLEQRNIESIVNKTFEKFHYPSNVILFTFHDLESIINNLKNSNVKGYDSISYSLIKNILDIEIRIFLLNFFNKILTLGVFPKKFNLSIIKPILKDQSKNTSDTNNIRPLSISNCLAQIFERLILINSPLLNCTHKNQFGFKKLTSCNHAIFCMKETISHYTENKSACRIASLDAEKAFDKVWRPGLFYKLRNKLDPTFWYLLKKYYDISGGVILNPDFSIFSEFDINCGVKQGGILSPFLFNIFINDLIEECTNSNIGALVGNLNISIIVYADDILLLSPVDYHLQRLLDICSNYSVLWRIKFNALKSNVITFGTPLLPHNKFFINNLELLKSDKLKYLGIEFDNSLNFEKMAVEKFKKVNKSVFSLSYLGLTPNGISTSLKSFLYKTYCLSQFTYALETTTLIQKTIKTLNINQNNIIRQIFGLKKYCHMSNILKCLKIHDINNLYIKSKLSFLESIKNNEISLNLFNFLCQDLNNIKKNSKSFRRDITLLQSKFDLDIEIILAGPILLMGSLKEEFCGDGLKDSINFCLDNIKNKFYKNLLDNLIKNNF